MTRLFCGVPWFAVLAASCLLTGGCTATAPRYIVGVSNTLALREAGLEKVKVGEVRKGTTAHADVEHVKARAMTVTSPYGSYTAYLREALINEFDHADLLDTGAAASIDGVLIRNVLGASGDHEYAELEAELTVTTHGGKIAYRARKSARYEWEAVFLGAVAVPRAMANYQIGVQRLIAAFIADPAFVAALKAR
jgi:hypothetical protein